MDCFLRGPWGVGAGVGAASLTQAMRNRPLERKLIFWKLDRLRLTADFGQIDSVVYVGTWRLGGGWFNFEGNGRRREVGVDTG